MKAELKKSSPLGVKEQIKLQLRLWIQSGDLGPGQSLPSCSDLAASLQVNRNTVWAAYQELAREGWLIGGQGKPAQVAPRKNLPLAADLKDILMNALEQAKKLGVEYSVARRYFLDYLGAARLDMLTARVVVVECNLPTAAKISEALQTGLGLSTNQMLIQDIEAAQGELPGMIGSADLVVTGVNHLHDLRSLLSGQDVKVMAVLFDLDLAIIKGLADLPPGGKVGFTCMHQRSAQSLFSSSAFSRGRSLNRLVVGADDGDALKDMMAQCDPVYATDLVYEKVIKLARPGQKVVRVDLNIDSDSLELIREQLIAAKGD